MGTTLQSRELYTYDPTDPDVVAAPDSAVSALCDGVSFVKRSAFEHIQDDPEIRRGVLEAIDRYARIRPRKDLPAQEDVRVDAPEGIALGDYVTRFAKQGAWLFGFNVAIINPLLINPDERTTRIVKALPRGNDCLIALIQHDGATETERHTSTRFEIDGVGSDDSGQFEIGQAMSQLAISLVHVFPSPSELL